MVHHLEETTEALKKIAAEKGVERARILEKITRLETAHFKSLQWKLSKSAGMEEGKWKNLNPSSYTTFQMKDNHLTGAKQMRTFIKWNTVYDFLLYLSDYIDRHNGNYARWNAIDPVRQEKYRTKVDKMRTKIII